MFVTPDLTGCHGYLPHWCYCHSAVPETGSVWENDDSSPRQAHLLEDSSFLLCGSTLDTSQSSKNIPLFVVTWSPRFNSTELVQVTSYDWLIDVLLVSRFGLVEENVVEIAITILFTSPRLSWCSFQVLLRKIITW
jgi:hypothetical protein